MYQNQSLVPIQWVVERTGLKRWRIYDLVKQQLIPCVYVGRRIYFQKDAIDAWIDQGGQRS